MSSPNTKEQISKSSNPTSTNTSSITIPIQFSNLFHSNSHRNSHKKENDNESFSSQIVYINSNPKQCVVIRPYDDICHLNSSFSPPSFDSYHHFGSPKKMFKIVNLIYINMLLESSFFIIIYFNSLMILAITIVRK